MSTLPVFRGSPTQRGYGLGGIFKGMLSKAAPILKDTAKVAGEHLFKTVLNEMSSGVKRKSLDVNRPIKKRRMAKKTIKATKKKRKASHKVPAGIVEAF